MIPEALTKLTPRSVLDIGANVGDFSVAASKVWAGAEFLLIEANRACEEHLRATGLPFIIAVLSDSSRDAIFYQRSCGGPSTGDSLYREKTPWYSDENIVETSVTTTTLDQLLENNGPFEFIKIDTQGSELDILSGGKNILGGAKWVLMEVSLEEYNSGAPLSGDAMKFMKDNGFSTSQEVGDIIHPIGRHIIQKDVLFTRDA